MMIQLDQFFSDSLPTTEKNGTKPNEDEEMEENYLSPMKISSATPKVASFKKHKFNFIDTNDETSLASHRVLNIN